LWETSLKGASTALPLSSNAETPETNAASVVTRGLLISRLSLEHGAWCLQPVIWLWAPAKNSGSATGYGPLLIEPKQRFVPGS
jgi:hypothetical protein